jgi:5'-methylthioadenosine phosphorylase
MLGIIGGSGLYELQGIKVLEELDIDTPFGKPSSPLLLGEIQGKRVVFLARHGREHSYPPHLIPYRANLWAFREVGVKRVLAVSAVGSINKLFRTGDLVLIDSFIDLTKRRESTYYEGKFSRPVEGNDKVAELLRNKKVVHIDVSEPYCPQMRTLLMDIMEEKRIRHHPAGNYACTEGPRFETVAEISMLEKFGADVVGMTGYPEVVLARELTMCYASLCVVANPAAGISAHRLTSEEVIELMSKKEEEIKALITEFILRIPEDRTCGCEDVLEGAEV